MSIPIYIVNAFSSGPFTGNPAAVCPLDQWLSDDLMQAIAAQNNLSETVFFVKEGNAYSIRWFTPTIEVPLCGHATLAAAYILFNELNYPGNEIRFQSKSGELKVIKEKDVIELNFPAEKLKKIPVTKNISQELDLKVIAAGIGRVFILLEVATEAEVIKANPDIQLLKKLNAAGVIITAKGDTADFVSRVFAPQSGIDEDPVTGSAHCLLIPYWAQKLNKYNLSAKQVSKRGGVLYCNYAGNRVLIGGKAELYSKGEIIMNYERKK
ncbi:MAG TPA: PhzF family phenazine biosynthesis protein [Cytophaga sp.]|nr:PhzF family phenazine biosynthesis protein [Cytophaga sp.]